MTDSFSNPLLRLIALVLAVPAFCQTPSTFRGNLEHTGVYDAAGAPSYTKIKWTFHTPGQVISSPAVAGATIYAGSTDVLSTRHRRCTSYTGSSER